jgi:hypothetical protein
LDINDFDESFDEVAGEHILKLKVEVAEQKHLTDLRRVTFQVIRNTDTGKEEIRMQGGKQAGDLGGNQRFELLYDIETSQQKIILKRPKWRIRMMLSMCFSLLNSFDVLR